MTPVVIQGERDKLPGRHGHGAATDDLLMKIVDLDEGAHFQDLNGHFPQDQLDGSRFGVIRPFSDES
jgi:hypothetical protein